MRKFITQIKPVIISLLILLISAVVSVALFAFFEYKPTQAKSVESDLEVQVGEALSLSLTNCDATNSSLVSVNVTPSSAGAFKSACQTITVDTNNPGYSLTTKASSSTLNYQNPTTIDPKPTIPATANTIASPGVLANDTWGFAVENAPDLPNFDTTYTVNNASNKFAALPTTDTPIYSTDEFPIPLTTHKFYYATKLTPATMAGTYATTITYTAVGEPIQPAPCEGEVIICIKVTEPGTIAIQNIWNSPITYTINGSDKILIASGELSTDLTVFAKDIIEVEEGTDNTTFRSWRYSSNGFITNTTSTGTARVSITKMPAMNRFTTNSTGTTAGNYFFQYFAGANETSDSAAAINDLPAGSFDISDITTVGNYFFYRFNSSGALTSLPAGSFDTSNITTTRISFFHYFNTSGALTSLPVGSFNISNITSAGDWFFANFNHYYGSLVTLPAGSFDTSNITTAGDFFFYQFNNYYGSLVTLPAGSFDTSNITLIGNSFFRDFNRSGALTSLPAGSFDTSNITTAGDYFFYFFNSSGALTSLPAGSFDTSNITTAGNDFFFGFNSSGALTSLPAGSFDTSNITTAGNDFFSRFNHSGALTSLPVGSFDTSNITTAVNGFFSSFNYSGALTSLPAGSFNISNITTAGDDFFNGFTHSGVLTSLPAGSFNTSNITSVGDSFFQFFNTYGALTSLPVGSFDTRNIIIAEAYFFYAFNDGGGKLQTGVGASTYVTITNKSPDTVIFYRRPLGNPDGSGSNTSVLVGETIIYLAE